ncbi:hypothetical protein VE00_00682 [Pseudogymnoascus sp. WSF 3629]|nr:hypothetical protein VE00_00682 [Pseudogymnoascus sp. WSF 3629]
MECRYCRKTFSKGEHLRRHERCHTGSRPFVCADCKRPFARQDALIRHERLHTRKEGAEYASPASSAATQAPVLSASMSQVVNTGVRRTAPSAEAGTPEQTWMEQQSMNSDVPDMLQAPDIGSDLIWPDSETLFQTIMSMDSTNQWQMPLGTLPFLPGVQQAGSDICDNQSNNFKSPDSFDDRGPAISAIPSGGSHRAVHDVSKMVSNLSSSVTAAIEATSITSVFLDECLHMFFVRFIPTFPVLHRATFVFRESTQPLLLNAMAIGSLYLGPKDSIAKGEALWRLAHIAVATNWETLITHRGPYDSCKGVQLVLTALLGQVYGALSKNRDVRTTSQAFHAIGFFWARHCGMFDNSPYPATNLPPLNAPEATIDQEWRIWTAREIQQRALLGHYVLDGLTARMSGRPTSVRHAANSLNLPSGEAAFGASTGIAWLNCMHSENPNPPTFRSIFSSLFSLQSPPPTNHTFSAFSFRVILEGLQSLVSDCADDHATVGVPAKPEVRTALLQVYTWITASTHLPSADTLEILLQWHTTCLNACIDSSLLCRHICARYSISQHVWGGSQAAIQGLDLVKWANSEDSRRALLHAIAIQEMVEQLPRGRAHVIHIPSCLFSAATIFSVFALAGIAQVNLPSVVDWKYLVSRADDASVVMTALAEASVSSETKRFVMGEHPSMFGVGGASRNLMYELNSMQKLFRCLTSQWGISIDMEVVMDQWIALCH